MQFTHSKTACFVLLIIGIDTEGNVDVDYEESFGSAVSALNLKQNSSTLS